MDRSIMTRSQFKYFIVDYNVDFLLQSFVSAKPQEVVFSLTEFIRMVNEELDATPVESSSIPRGARRGKYPMQIYPNLQGRSKGIVNFLDLVVREYEKLKISSTDQNEIHEALYERIKGHMATFFKEYGRDLSMFYECLLYNVILLNMRAFRVPYERVKHKRGILQTEPIYPVRIIPKLGPELAIVLNPQVVDLPTFSVMRDRLDTTGSSLFCTLEGDVQKLRTFSTKKPKFEYVHFLQSFGITPEDIANSESTYLSHAGSTTTDVDKINSVTQAVREHVNFTRVLRFLIADLESYNEYSLKYLVEFE